MITKKNNAVTIREPMIRPIPFRERGTVFFSSIRCIKKLRTKEPFVAAMMSATVMPRATPKSMYETATVKTVSTARAAATFL